MPSILQRFTFFAQTAVLARELFSFLVFQTCFSHPRGGLLTMMFCCRVWVRSRLKFDSQQWQNAWMRAKCKNAGALIISCMLKNPWLLKLIQSQTTMVSLIACLLLWDIKGTLKENIVQLDGCITRLKVYHRFLCANVSLCCLENCHRRSRCCSSIWTARVKTDKLT